MRSLGKNVWFLAALCLVFGLAFVTAAAGPAEKCANGKDDDRDGLTDCADPDCSVDPACVGPPPPPPDNCQLLFSGDFTDGTAVTSDEESCIADPDYQYCDSDQKVFMGFSISGGDGDPRAIFAFDSNTGPVKTRKGEVVRQAWIDLSGFDDEGDTDCWKRDPDDPDDPEDLDPFGGCAKSGELPIVLGFYSGRGGLNLCDLCVPGSAGCTDTCYMGHELDVDQIGGALCGTDESSSKGAVGLYLNFPVENAIWDKMAMIRSLGVTPAVRATVFMRDSCANRRFLSFCASVTPSVNKSRPSLCRSCAVA